MAGSPHFADAPLGLLCHDPNELRARHCHDDPFVAVVLEGGYQEAGDEGRFDVRPGDALIHHAYESHLDRVEAKGARVLVLDLPPELPDSPHVRGHVADPDALVRIAARDPRAASALSPKISSPPPPPRSIGPIYSRTTSALTRVSRSPTGPSVRVCAPKL